MLKDSVSKFVIGYSIQNSGDIEPILQFNPEVTQVDIMTRIHTEFQKPFIKKLYPNPEWQQRVFWNVTGKLVLDFDDLEMDVSLDRITMAINQYIKERRI